MRRLWPAIHVDGSGTTLLYVEAAQSAETLPIVQTSPATDNQSGPWGHSMMPPARAIPGRVFGEPDPLRSLQQFERYHGFDIERLSDADLTDEFRYLAARVWPLRPEDWRHERVRMLGAELQRRRAGVRT